MKYYNFEKLEKLWDFKVKLKFDCSSSFIPFVKSFTPSNTFWITKVSSTVRLDMTQGKHKLSMIYKGRGTDNEGELKYIDHWFKNSFQIFTNELGEEEIKYEVKKIKESLKSSKSTELGSI